jgi:hypothetical protein
LKHLITREQHGGEEQVFEDKEMRDDAFIAGDIAEPFTASTFISSSLQKNDSKSSPIDNNGSTINSNLATPYVSYTPYDSSSFVSPQVVGSLMRVDERKHQSQGFQLKDYHNTLMQ